MDAAPPLRWGGESPRVAAGTRPDSPPFRPASGSPLRGLLSSVLASGGGGGAGGGLRVSSSVSDLEQPLLPASDREELELLGHLLAPKAWPMLRGSSASARRITHADLPSSPLGATASPFTSLPPAAPVAADGAAAEGHTHKPGQAGKAAPSRAVRYGRATVAGFINSIVALPLQLAFAAIIFRVRHSLPLLGWVTRTAEWSAHTLPPTSWLAATAGAARLRRRTRSSNPCSAPS